MWTEFFLSVFMHRNLWYYAFVPRANVMSVTGSHPSPHGGWWPWAERRKPSESWKVQPDGTAVKCRQSRSMSRDSGLTGNLKTATKKRRWPTWCVHRTCVDTLWRSSSAGFLPASPSMASHRVWARLAGTSL